MRGRNAHQRETGVEKRRRRERSGEALTLKESLTSFGHTSAATAADAAADAARVSPFHSSLSVERHSCLRRPIQLWQVPTFCQSTHCAVRLHDGLRSLEQLIVANVKRSQLLSKSTAVPITDLVKFCVLPEESLFLLTGKRSKTLSTEPAPRCSKPSGRAGNLI